MGTCHGAAALGEAGSGSALAERIFEGSIATLEIYSIYLGRKLGLYAALHEHGVSTVGELALSAGIDERYAREWLEQQAVAGLLSTDDPDAAADRRRYALPREHVGVLVDDLDESHVAPFAEMLVGLATALPAVVDAYRSGNGVPFEHYGADMRDGQAGINKPAFSSELTGSWLPTVADLHARLEQRTPSARIADVGCGAGWSTIALARAYPHAAVIGYDLDEASIADARRNAEAAGVNVRFERKHAGELHRDGPFDAILVLEALHDMAFPSEALAAMRKALVRGGSVFVADERVAERFNAPGDAIERMMYGWSVLACLPSSRCEPGAEAVGTAIRPATVRDCAERAGLTRFEILPIDNELFRFYRLRDEI